MKRFASSDLIYITQSKIPFAGRGVFASHNIKKGETIENCPMIEVSEDDFGQTIFAEYLFHFGKGKKRSALALGYGSVYNHSIHPNATFVIDQKNFLIKFVAIKNIKTDEEITFDYYHGSPKKSPLWFQV